MMHTEERIVAWSTLGEKIRQFLSRETPEGEWEEKLSHAISYAKHHNGWFEAAEVRRSLAEWGEALTSDNLKQWLGEYSAEALANEQSVKVGIVMAGNIPLVGLHDLLCVSLSGHRAMVKYSSDDNQLLPILLSALGPLADSIDAVERLNGMDAVIATGSDNTARYFEHYFGVYPHIIRKNRKSVAVLDGSESEEDLRTLGEDVFTYFGLGCRSVNKLYLPADFELDRIFGAWLPFQYAIDNKKYANNYDYHRALFLLDREPFLENGFVVLRENESYSSPVSIIHYERYDQIDSVKEALKTDRDKLQCVATRQNWSDLPIVDFGKTQSPSLSDYADGVDTMAFLLELKND